jgi:bacillithiol biosynthesis cysteine-adding enzyme BshC
MSGMNRFSISEQENDGPCSGTARKAAIERAAARQIDPLVLQALREINASLPPSPTRDSFLADAQKPGAVFLVTGQQLGLCLGPLFTLYKTISVIETARLLSREYARPVIPVFWLQGEDHDLPEINTLPVLSADGERKVFSLPFAQQGDGRISVAQYRLDSSVENLFAELRTVFGNRLLPDTLELFERHYRPGVTLLTAFAAAMAELFAEDGLLFFHPQHPLLGPLLSPMYSRVFNEREKISRILLERAGQLREQHEDVQVHIRERSPLFFFHPASALGPRYRLREQGETFEVIGTGEVVSAAEIEQALQSDIGRFSSSALLRPLIQDLLLPNAGYIGGAAELRYFRQIEPLYPLLGMEQAPPIQRSSFVLIDAKARRLLEQLSTDSLSMSSLPPPQDDFADYYIQASLPPEMRLESVRGELDHTVLQSVEQIRQRIAAVDNRLASAFDRSQEKIERAISGITDRYQQLLQEKNQSTAERGKKLQLLLAPDGVAQERSYSFLSFWCRFGPEFLQQVRKSFVPFQPNTLHIHL